MADERHAFDASRFRGSRWRGGGGGSSSSVSRRRESPEDGGSSSASIGHTQTFSTSFTSSRSVYFGTSSGSAPSEDEFWPPHRTSPVNSSSSVSSGSDASRSLRLRLAFHGRRGERVEALESESTTTSTSSHDDYYHGGRRRVFLSVVDDLASSRNRSTEYCLEDNSSSSGSGGRIMLPGVEVARRRRVRVAETYEGRGGGFEALSQSSSRSSRSGVAVAHNHHHHHHRYHVHHQTPRHPSRPGTPRPGSLVRRMQDILQEHRSRSPASHVGNYNSDSSNVGAESSSSAVHHGPHRSSRGYGYGHRSGGEPESRPPPASSLWRRQSYDSSSSNLRGAALEARNRLDERLRAAAHSSHSRRNWQAVQSSYDMNFLFSDEDEDNPLSDDDSWETSLHEWLAAWAPSVEERWNRVESSSSGRSGSSSRVPSFKPRPSEGLSKAAINALPRIVVGSVVTQGVGERNKMEQEDCPVCLEGFVVGQSLMSLPCKHRFHPECLTPWLANHGQCPYCRAEIVKESDRPEQKSRLGSGDEDLLSWVEAIERGMDRLSYS